MAEETTLGPAGSSGKSLVAVANVRVDPVTAGRRLARWRATILGWEVGVGCGGWEASWADDKLTVGPLPDRPAEPLGARGGGRHNPPSSRSALAALRPRFRSPATKVASSATRGLNA